MNPRSKVILWSALALAAVAAGTLLAWLGPGRGSEYFSDGGTIREGAREAPNRRVLWQPPVSVGAPLNSGAEEYEPRPSADGLTMFFVRGRAGSNADLFSATRTPGGWSEPVAIASLNTAEDELSPEISPDGLMLYFASNRAGGLGGYDLWVSHRPAGGEWAAPVNLGPNINSAFDEYTPALRPDGGALCFASNRPRPGEDPAKVTTAWPATIRENGARHDFDLYVASVGGGHDAAATGAPADSFGTATALAALNTVYSEGTPAFSPVGDFLYFASDRPGGWGGLDLWRSRIVRGEFRAPENLGSAVNSAYQDLDPAPSMGGFALHFSSNRPVEDSGVRGGVEGVEGVGIGQKPDATAAGATDYNLYATSSREVFLERERQQTDWASLWSAIWPPLLWLLLLVLLAWLLYKMRGRLHDRQLSVLAKCLIASLFLHLIVLFLLSLWGVGSSLGQYFRRPGGGGGKVQLASSGTGDTMAGQVRGGLTEVSVSPRTERATVSPPELQISPSSPDFARFEAPKLEVRPEPAANRTEARESLAQAAPPIPVMRPEPAAMPMQGVAVPAEARPAEAGETGITVTARAPEGVTAPAPPQAPAVSSTTLATAAPRLDAPVPAATAGVAPAREAAPVTTPIGIAVRAPAEAQIEMVAAGIPAQGAPAKTSERALSVGARGSGPTAAPPAPAVAVATPASGPDTVAMIGAPTLGAGAAREKMTAHESVPGLIGLPIARNVPPEGVGTEISMPAVPASPEASAAGGPSEPSLAISAPGAPAASRGGRTESVAVPTSVPVVRTAPPGEPGAGIAAAGPAAPSAREAQVGIGQSSSLGLGVPTIPDASSSVSQVDVPGESPAAPFAVAEASAPAIGHDSASTDRGVVAPPLMSVVEAPAGKSMLSRTLPGAAGVPAPGLRRPTTAAEAPSARGQAGASFGLADPDVPPMPAVDLALPTELAPTENPFAQRAPQTRAAIVERLGGSSKTEEAVASALDWLSRHQSEDGRWSSMHYDRECGHCSGQPSINSDKAVTGLALLCFLGADHTHVKDGPYRETVTRAVKWLVDQQEESGSLRRNESMYSHGIATIALCEASAMTHDPALKEPAQKAAAFIVKACDPESGGWRYEPGQAGDTSVLGWQVMALVSARRAGVEIPEETLKSASRFLDEVSRQKAGIYCYQPGSAPTPAMTAEGLFVRQLLGHKPDESMMRSSVKFLAKNPPRWEKSANTYYWYYGTLALFQQQGDEWTKWNEALTGVLLERQRDDGPASGSWDPKDRWSLVGGRVYQTALCTLCLEVYYRYLPMYGAGADAAAPKERMGAGSGPEGE